MDDSSRTSPALCAGYGFPDLSDNLMALLVSEG